MGGASPDRPIKGVTPLPLFFFRVLNNYMIWRVVASLAPSLSEEFRNAHEDLVKVLTGSKRSEDLWKRCMGETDDAIGMALGSLFIKKAFDGSSKQQVLRQALDRRDRGWCSGESARLTPMSPGFYSGPWFFQVLRFSLRKYQHFQISNSTRIEKLHENQLRVMRLPL